MTYTTIDDVLQDCKEVLQAHYGARLKGLVLYGSTAQSQARPDSDIDLLVLLTDPFDFFHELRQIIDLLYPVQLESERLISAKPAAVDDFEAGSIQLYRSAKREGLSL